MDRGFSIYFRIFPYDRSRPVKKKPINNPFLSWIDTNYNDNRLQISLVESGYTQA
jgi:hypothetical protein